MNKKIFIVLLLLLIAGLSVGPLSSKIWRYFDNESYSDAAFRFATYHRQEVFIGTKSYTLFIADTDDKRTQGLSDVKNMDQSEGMLFTFDSPKEQNFWMKDMHFSLDFIYVHQGKVVDLKRNVSPDTYPDILVSKSLSDGVIELNAGEIKANGIKIGDHIDLR